MKDKKNNSEIIGTCGICHLGIKHVEDYVKIADYIKGQLNSEGFYHRMCFRNKLNGTPELKSLQEMAKNIMTRASSVMASRGI
jgi:hypothetical protein